MTTAWRFAPVAEADFEPLLAIRIEVMREHLERVFRYKPSRARRIFREHFAEPGLRSILIGDGNADKLDGLDHRRLLWSAGFERGEREGK